MAGRQGVTLQAVQVSEKATAEEGERQHQTHSHDGNGELARPEAQIRKRHRQHP